MGVIMYSFNVNISPKMSYGVLECDIMLQNNCNKRLCNKKGVLFVPDLVLSILSKKVKAWNVFGRESSELPKKISYQKQSNIHKY